MSKEMEQRFLRDLQPSPARSAQELAPEPVVTIFKSYSINCIKGVDPVSGKELISIVFTAGNYSQQHIYALDRLMVASLIKLLQQKLGSNNGDDSP